MNDKYSVLIAAEYPDSGDGRYPAWDLTDMKGVLEASGLVSRVHCFHYAHYADPNNALKEECKKVKPDAVILSLQNINVRPNGITAPGVAAITHGLQIPTALIWYSIYADSITDLMEYYHATATADVILGADNTSHKPLTKEKNVYAYAMMPISPGSFKPCESEPRNIGIGMLGSLLPFRVAWIDGLQKHGIQVFNKGGQLVGTDTSFASGKVPSGWISYEQYLKTTSQMKIALNVSSGLPPHYLKGSSGRSVTNALRYLRAGFGQFALHPGRWRQTRSAVQKVKDIATTTPREMVRRRVVEALYCKTLLLEEENSITRMYLEPYKDYVPFETLRELVFHIKHYLSHVAEWDQIRLNGQRALVKYYNPLKFATNLLELLDLPAGSQNYHVPGEIWNKEFFRNQELNRGR